MSIDSQVLKIKILTIPQKKRLGNNYDVEISLPNATTLQKQHKIDT